MRAICVDDEELVLRLTISLCELSPLVDEAKGFTRAAEVLSYLEENRADIAILDVDMPDMDGISLAMKIKEKRPEIAVIFLTGYSQYAVDAFAIHASGYLLKPVSRERLFSEIEYALKGRSVENNKELFVRTANPLVFLGLNPKNFWLISWTDKGETLLVRPFSPRFGKTAFTIGRCKNISTR